MRTFAENYRNALLAVFVGVVGAIWIIELAYWVSQLDEIVLGDFATYWVGARHGLAGDGIYPGWQLESAYRLGFASNGRGYVYPPTSVVLTAPLGVIPLSVAWAVVTVASAVGLILVGAAIGRNHGLTLKSSLLLGLAFVTSPPALESLTTGNANTQVALAVALLWVRPGVSGYLAVIGGLVKLYPAVAVAWVIRKRTSLIGPIALGAGLFAVSLVWLGIGAWRDFITVTVNARPGSDFIVPSIRAGLGPILGTGLADGLSYVVTAILLIAVIRIGDDRMAIFLLSLAMIAPAPDWYLHYFVVPLAGALPIVAKVWSDRSVPSDGDSRDPRVQRFGPLTTAR